MGHFIITFRIKSDDDYQDRYDSFTKRIREIAPDGTWDETSSFYALESSNTAAGICNDLWLKTSFSPSKDMMLIIDLDRREKALKGDLKYPNTLDRCLGF